LGGRFMALIMVGLLEYAMVVVGGRQPKRWTLRLVFKFYDENSYCSGTVIFLQK